MTRTALSYTDCMAMPYVVMLDLIKHIQISELSQNDEWREAYLKQLTADRLERQRDSGKLQNTTMDLSALQAFGVAH